MNDANHSVASLTFALDVEDGWPPVAAESIPFDMVEDGYKCQKAPIYVKGLAVGDVIEPVIDNVNGMVFEWSHIRHSGHSTIWLLRLDSPNNISEILEQFRTIGCSTVELAPFGSYSIDVPPQVSIGDVDQVLSHLNPDVVTTAFPVFRHIEED
jgi:hypothetical protein